MNEMPKKTVVFLVGPTACHKTEAAVELCKRLNGEVVSADSVQVYRDMDIGSAKPTMEERQGIPHHMMDCVSIDDRAFSVAKYREMALAAIQEIQKRGKLPVVTGGSGLYISALTSPLNFAVPGNPEIRAALNAKYDAAPEQVYRQLQLADPATAERLHPNDKKRIVRALEIFQSSGKPLSTYGNAFHTVQDEALPYNVLLLGVTMERDVLYQGIDMRVERMMETGLLDEARRIYTMGYDRQLPAMQSIGYKQLFAFFDGTCSCEEAVEAIKRDTRRYAKRQLTWFRRDTRIHWTDVTQWTPAHIDAMEQTIREREESHA